MALLDWVLALHVLSAVALVGSLAVFWALVLATRPGAALLPAEAAGAFGRPASYMIGVGTLGTIVFGVWLALDIDAYEIWDGWILASLALWAVGTETGRRSGGEFTRATIGGASASEASRRAVLLLAASSVATLLVLVLMIWKPGA